MSDRAFAADAQTMTALAPGTQVRMLESLARFEIEAFERVRAVAGSGDPAAAAIEIRREEALQDVLRRALHLGDYEVTRRPLAQPLGLLPKFLHPLRPVGLRPAERLALAATGELRRSDGTHRLGHRPTCDTGPSTCRSSATISSGSFLFWPRPSSSVRFDDLPQE